MTDAPFLHPHVEPVDLIAAHADRLEIDVQTQSRPDTPSARADQAFAYRLGDRDGDRSFGALF
jgi:hypothetical protein